MQSSTRNKTLTIAAVVVLALCLAAGAVWYWMGQPLYEPDIVSAGKGLGARLTPPLQSRDSDRWVVEKDIGLHHFAVGAGENVLIVDGRPGKRITEPCAGLDALKGRCRFGLSCTALMAATWRSLPGRAAGASM